MIAEIALFLYNRENLAVAWSLQPFQSYSIPMVSVLWIEVLLLIGLTDDIIIMNMHMHVHKTLMLTF